MSEDVARNTKYDTIWSLVRAPTCIRIPPYSSRTAPIHQYTPEQNSTPTYSRRLLRMNVITFETWWAIKNFHKVTPSWFNLFNYVATLGLRRQGRLCTIPVWSIGNMYFENEPAIMASSHFQLHPGLTCPAVIREVSLTHFILSTWTLQTVTYFSPSLQTSDIAGS